MIFEPCEAYMHTRVVDVVDPCSTLGLEEREVALNKIVGFRSYKL